MDSPSSASNARVMNDSTKPEGEQPNDGKVVNPADPSGQQPGTTDNDPEADKAEKTAPDDSKKDKDANEAPHHPIAEFLYQLTKMLQEDNSEIIEWSNGRIKVHHPDRLEQEVLHKYFRHSKFASFQRQLNYFGFRKIAGKGKMAPCSYVNEACTSDIRSLLHIKRKTNGSAARKAAMNRALQAERMQQAAAGAFGAFSLPPQMSGNMADLMSKALSAGYLQGAASAGAAPNPALLGLSQQLQQASQQLQQTPNLFSTDQALAAFAAGQKRQSASDFARFGLNPSQGALEQLANQQTAAQQTAQQALNQQLASLSGMSQNDQSGQQASTATAATQSPGAMANAMPATAAMNAAASSVKSNLFENTPNLTSLVNQQQQQQAQQQQQQQQQQAGQAAKGAVNSNRVASQSLLNRLPSSGTIFPDSLSTASLSQMLQPAGRLSSNRLNSMISLSSYLSREPSLVDLLLAAGGGQGGAAGQLPGAAGQLPGAGQLAGAAAQLPPGLQAAAGLQAPASNDPTKNFGNGGM